MSGVIDYCLGVSTPSTWYRCMYCIYINRALSIRSTRGLRLCTTCVVYDVYRQYMVYVEGSRSPVPCNNRVHPTPWFTFKRRAYLLHYVKGVRIKRFYPLVELTDCEKTGFRCIIVSSNYNTYTMDKCNLSHVSNTRGNIYKLQLTHMHYNLPKHFFSNRIVAVWNSLPNIVVSAESNIFKNRLDKFWINQEF